MHRLNRQHLLNGTLLLLMIALLLIAIPLARRSLQLAGELFEARSRILSAESLGEDIVRLTEQVRAQDQRIAGALVSLPSSETASLIYAELLSHAGRFNVPLTEIVPGEVDRSTDPGFMPMQVIIECRFHDLLSLVNAIEHTSRSLLIRELHIAPHKKLSGHLAVSLLLEAYVREPDD